MRRVFLLAAVFLLVAAPSALARPIVPSPTSPNPPPPAAPTAPSSSGDSGVVEAPDVTQSLGGTDSNCKHLNGASAIVVRNCQASGLAESAYPPGNYGIDSHVDTGVTNISGDVESLFQTVIGGIYELVADVLTWILLGLGLAFGFDLFASDKTGQIPHAMLNAEHFFSFPVIPVVLVVGAVMGMVYWFAHHDEGKAVVHWAAMFGMIAVGIIILQNPIGVFGWLDRASNGAANGALSAFPGGSGGGTTSGFANALPSLYTSTMEEPWCAMEFGNVSWCMSPIDSKMAAARDQVLQHLPQALGDQGSQQEAIAEEPVERLRLAAAKTNGELFLAFPPNANARNGKNDTWTLYHALLNDHPQLAAIRGGGGVWKRCAVLLLTSFVGLFFILVLLYIAWQLVIASVKFVMGLLAMAVVIFTPAFGEKGRGIFLAWFAFTLGALLKRVIFAVFLGLILTCSNVLLLMDKTTGGWLIQWLLLAAVWAMAIVYRHQLLEMMTGGAHHDSGHQQMRGQVYRRWREGRYELDRITSRRGRHLNHGGSPGQNGARHYYREGDEYHVHYERDPAPRSVDPISEPIEGTAEDIGERELLP